MDNHSLRVLEFDRVLQRLADLTTNSLGREAALQLSPATAEAVVTRRLQETHEARLLFERGNALPLGGIFDVRDAVSRAALEAVLSPRELLEIGSTAGAGRRLKSFLAKQRETALLLSEIGTHLPVPPNIEARIEEAIAPNAELKDSASAALAEIRRNLRATQLRLTQKLQAILAGEKARNAVQESLITVRDGRYCIPLKAEFKNALGGIVHDASASGATVYVEPGATVEMGNELRELALKEQQEVHRVLARLSGMVGAARLELTALCSMLGNLDLAHAKGQLAIALDASCPSINQRGRVRLRRARHPLLSGDVVPIDMELGGDFTTLLITGPNTGGKTVTLKTIGLLTLMLQSGMQIPADEDSDLALFDNVFADIGDEQSIQQSLSTFSAHLRNIARILADMPPNALVLLDEVGAGTDPAEGAALAKALLTELRKRGARVVATSHYGELKEYAFSEEGVENAAVEFDRETLRPTYRVLQGVPGSSHAFYIAERLGLPTEIVRAARENLGVRDRNTADLLQQIEESRRRTLELERQAERDRAAAEAAREEYERRVREVADVQRTVRRDAEEEVRLILKRATEKSENILEELRRMNRGGRKGPMARKKLIALKQETAEELKTQPETAPEPVLLEPGRILKRGDHVRVTTLGADGVLLDDPKDGHAPVQIGVLRATLPLEVLQAVKPPKQKQAPASRSVQTDTMLRKAQYLSTEVNLRAMRVEEAHPLLEKYLDDAYAAGLQQACIIHGKGTGALRKWVWEYLKTHPAVDTYRLGDESEGADGVTVVQLKP
jgi:DNA mismatch repair protein MutS2